MHQHISCGAPIFYWRDDVGGALGALGATLIFLWWVFRGALGALGALGATPTIVLTP